MALVLIHIKDEPKESWIEVDGYKVEGIKSVVGSRERESGEITCTFYAAGDEHVGIVFEDWEDQ